MYSIKIPKPKSVAKPKNAIGLTIDDYAGAPSTLCGGCGHDSVTAAIIEACYKMAIWPHQVAKVSGIGCSSKTPAYFLKTAHAFNSVHGRMPSVASGAYMAHGGLYYLGVSGDGDSGSIGIGQLIHGIRRQIKMLYIIENNGVYGLTKGQFSATADMGSINSHKQPNPWAPIDLLEMGLQLGATFIGRSFSGDKEQLVPLICAGLAHPGFALLDVLSPCVSFNNHMGSTKSYAHIRKKEHSPLEAEDYIPKAKAHTVSYEAGTSVEVDLADGGSWRLRKLLPEYDPQNAEHARQFLHECRTRGEIATGLLYWKKDATNYHQQMQTCAKPLRDLPFGSLCPGAAAMIDINASFR